VIAYKELDEEGTYSHSRFISAHSSNLPFAGEGKTAHFGLAGRNPSRAVIWALTWFGYLRKGRFLGRAKNVARLTKNGPSRTGRGAQG